jgi:hypothetical protein
LAQAPADDFAENQKKKKKLEEEQKSDPKEDPMMKLYNQLYKTVAGINSALYDPIRNIGKNLAQKGVDTVVEKVKSKFSSPESDSANQQSPAPVTPPPTQPQINVINVDSNPPPAQRQSTRASTQKVSSDSVDDEPELPVDEKGVDEPKPKASGNPPEEAPPVVEPVNSGSEVEASGNPPDEGPDNDVSEVEASGNPPDGTPAIEEPGSEVSEVEASGNPPDGTPAIEEPDSDVSDVEASGNPPEVLPSVDEPVSDDSDVEVSGNPPEESPPVQEQDNGLSAQTVSSPAPITAMTPFPNTPSPNQEDSLKQANTEKYDKISEKPAPSVTQNADMENTSGLSNAI